MKSSEVIKLLQELDPTGEVEVSVGNVDIMDIGLLPAYYDGCLQVLKKDLAKECYNIIGLEFKSEGSKIVISPYDIEDYILDHHGRLDKLNIIFDHEPNQWHLDRIEEHKKKATELHEKLEEMKQKIPKENK